jgi:hypothetical protein|tara:strand:- start:1546 stop:1791 length:246 start_codon:yes stop_codon:yes gene_type:complete
MKNLVVSMHVIWLLVWTYMLIFEIGENVDGLEDYLIVLANFTLPIVTLYYLYHSESEGESLLSLWLKVRKKKLKDELEDSD